MAEKATIEIDAPLEAVAAIIFDVESYPTWSTTIKKVESVNKDGAGRVNGATITFDSGVMKDRVTLDYDSSAYPKKISFSLNDADLLTKMDGTFELSSLDSDSTSVTYYLDTAVSMPVPQMMISKVEKQTINLALSQLKEHIEG